MSRLSRFLEILEVATRQGIHRRLFSSDNLISKNINNLSLAEARLTKTKDYSLQPRTLLNSSQIFSLRSFEIGAAKIWKKSGKMFEVGLPLIKIIRLQCTGDCWTKNSTTDTFLEMLRMESFAKLSFFLSRYWSAFQVFWRNKKRLPEKRFL